MDKWEHASVFISFEGDFQATINNTQITGMDNILHYISDQGGELISIIPLMWDNLPSPDGVSKTLIKQLMAVVKYKAE